MEEVVTTAQLVKGRLRLRNWNRVASELARMRDCELRVAITKARATRSNQQNRWYWGYVVGLVAEHTGYTPDEIHEIYKAKFIPKTLALANGNGEIVGECVIGGTTTRLDKLQFSEYCEAIREWAADALGVVIPDPNEASV